MVNRRGGKKNKKRWILIGILMAAMMATASFAMGDTPGQLSGKTSVQSAQGNDAALDNTGDFIITGDNNPTAGNDYTYDDKTGVLTIQSSKKMTISNKSGVETTSNRIEIASEANLTLAGVNINTSKGPALKIADNATFNVNITLADDTTSTLCTTALKSAGLQKSSAKETGVGSLTIQGGINGTGSLGAKGGMLAAGIGGGDKKSGSNITISGGKVEALSPVGGAGIGGGASGSGSDITISGGTVTGTGALDGAGIGGGIHGNGSNITISGGKVKATGVDQAAGIGGGSDGSGSNITISGGAVTATGKKGYDGAGAGIGGGKSGSDNKMEGNVVVMATSGDTNKEALEGFDLKQGIAFVKKGEDDTVKFTGTVYGNIAFSDLLGGELTVPANTDTLTIPEGSALTVNDGKKFTVPDGVTLNNAGTLNADATGYGTIDCAGAKSKVQTYVKYNSDGGNGVPNDHYVVYKTNGGQQTYVAEDVSEATKTDWFFAKWYADADKTKSRVTTDTLVYLNEHTLYAKWIDVPFEVTGGARNTDWAYDTASGALKVLTANNALTIKDADTTQAKNCRIEISEGIAAGQTVQLTLAGLNIETSTGPALKIADNALYNVTITLADGTTNTLKATADNFAGLQKDNSWHADTGVLTIQGGKEGTGSLAVTGGNGAAGIGGGYDGIGIDITISGGTVTAKGGKGGAGIGGGDYGSGDGGTGSNITISGGTVTANGGNNAAGIGGGESGGGSNITISGGEVKTTGGNNAAGIGGGDNGEALGIEIKNNGTVEAIGGGGGAGIGGGCYGAGRSIVIKNDSTVKANGGENGAGIGGGNGKTGSAITISGGTVTAKGGTGGTGIGGGCGGTGSNITISGGTVTATGGDYGAGIGGSGITISGGTVNATGGNFGAGIGGGCDARGSNIEIKGGQVEATGGTGAAGIGGGSNGSGSAITINSGTVAAKGGDCGAGIGGGADGNGSNITISGGEVTAKGGNDTDGGAGIGGGDEGSGSNITISGGEVTATGGRFAAGIGGGGYGGSGSNITINSGRVTAIGGSGDYHHRDEYFSHYGGGAGIGGGANCTETPGNGSNIIISGGQVKATGRDGGAGIGGGGGVSGDTSSAPGGIGSNITISGGMVEATGSLLTPANIFWTKQGGAGIGSGARGYGAKNNKLEGNAVVVATSGWEKNVALGGFSLKQGIAFTRQGTSGSWSKGMYGDVAITADATFPTNLTIPEGKTLTVNKDVTLTIPDNVTLKNEGTLTNNGTIACQGTGKVTTLLQYGGNGGTPDASSKEYTYLDSSMAAKTYGDLATATRDGYDFAGWYNQAEGGTQILAGDKVNVNLHTVYAHWTEKQSAVTPSSEGKSDASSEAISGGDKVTKSNNLKQEGNIPSMVGTTKMKCINA